MPSTRHHRSVPQFSRLTRFMSSLNDDQARLREIQSTYDNLSLLGQLLCAGTDISAMRNDFNMLATELLEQLARELQRKAVQNLGSNARVAIDLLVRNLYERTADIGFLATDADIRSYAETYAESATGIAPARFDALRQRFREYVRKYSVYHNIILLAPDGQVLAQLDEHNPVTSSADRLVTEALTASAPYVEVFRKTDLLPAETAPLIYAYRVMSADGSRPVGVLCLCFRFADECERIFNSLLDENDWTVITLLDDSGRVIASSDQYQFPLGAQVEYGLGEASRIIRFAGREYLATTRAAQSYQGYGGPGWMGHALTPLEHAFDMAVAHELEAVPDAIRAGVLETTKLFTPDLRAIPQRATTIQRELNRAVWNGHLWLSRDGAALNGAFAKVLLREIGSTGARTHKVFAESTTNLYETVLSSVLHDCAAKSALAMDIMDRNLYERANDCRWWALTSAFRSALASDATTPGEWRGPLTDILSTINGLYTVYTNLLIFDASGTVVAVSNPASAGLIGEHLQGEWVRATLALTDSQRYCVSPFAATRLYDDQPTWTYAAAIRAPGTGGAVVGGIAIVFDAEPQLVAMLEDSLPRKDDGTVYDEAFAVFADRDGQVIASTDASFKPGDRIELERSFFDLAPGTSCANIVAVGNRYYAVGSRMSSGYREYKGPDDRYRNDLVAIVLVPLSDRLALEFDARFGALAPGSGFAPHSARNEESVEVATFTIAGTRYGVRTNFVVEAIDRQNITAVPGMPDWVRGCIMYQGQAVSIFDLSTMLPGRAPLRTAGQIVVLHVPAYQAKFGILVDELGDIPEIPASQVEPIPAMMGHSRQALTESLVKPRPQSGEHILIMLSAEAIFRRLTGINADAMDDTAGTTRRLELQHGANKA